MNIEQMSDEAIKMCSEHPSCTGCELNDGMPHQIGNSTVVCGNANKNT